MSWSLAHIPLSGTTLGLVQDKALASVCSGDVSGDSYIWVGEGNKSYSSGSQSVVPQKNSFSITWILAEM